MSKAFDSELRMAVAEGLLSREEAEALREEALRLGRAPLDLLVERGKLSADSLVSLRKEDQEQTRTTMKPVDDTITVQRPSGKVPVLQAADFPVPGWERYQFMRLLGQGGMGRVFLAHDPRLRRDVALKFVRDDDSDAARRFVFEARAQARVVHERVCQVYEVGEVQGKTFIAMQYIDGQPLNQLAGKLSPEQKAMVLRDAAEGVHAAHRVGLIHRDLKPSNIMVERPQDGSLKTYVMDFGLARDWKEGMTASGSVLGTPHYMAPEQARGEVTRLDRRADVYSLGATLYHLLTGTHPIQGSNHLEVLSNIPLVEPRPLRALDKDIPVDLEAIVLKCLEKERSARYDSARALAEDLDRFLNGEPVHARPAGLWYRLRKKARRHRAAVTTGSMALAVATFAVGYNVHLRRQSTQLQRLAIQLIGDVKDLESDARQSHLSPRHDLGPDQKRIREGIDRLNTTMHQAGDLGLGPGHYALGRGYLALGDKQKAREHLEAAWERNYQNQQPHLAYTLALVLGQLYQEQRLEMEREYRQRLGKPLEGEPPAEQWLGTRRQKLEQDWLEPVLEKLRWLEGKDASVPRAYVQALLAFYEGRLDEAQQHLKALRDLPRWFYEVHQLRGDILLASALSHWNHGDATRARAGFRASHLAYEEAAKTGQSDPALHHAMAQLERAWLHLELSSKGEAAEVRALYDRGLETVKHTLEIQPGHYETRLLEARIHLLLAWYQNVQGEQVQPLLERALATARELAPQQPKTRVELGWIHWQWAQSRLERKEDPGGQLRAALDAIDKLDPKNQDPEVHQLRGRIYKTWASHEQRNPDPDAGARKELPLLDKAIESFRVASTMDPRLVSSRVCLGTAYLDRALNRHNPDAQGDLEQARKTLAEARRLNPDYLSSYYYEMRVYRRMAERTRRRGEDPRPEYREALALCEQVLTRSSNYTQCRSNKAQILTELAREEWERGGDPLPLLEDAGKQLAQAVLTEPKNYFIHNSIGDMHAWGAEYLAMRGEKPDPRVREGKQALDRASELRPKSHYPLANLGWLYNIQAAFELDRDDDKHDPSKFLGLAMKKIEEANKLHPDGFTSLQHGRNLELQARWKVRKRQASAGDFRQAERAFLEALELDPGNQEFRLALGRFYWEWASWMDKEDGTAGPLAKGLTVADGLWRERPQWQDARVLRALLLLLAKDSASPGQHRLQVREELDQLLKANPNLGHQWKRQLRHIQ